MSDGDSRRTRTRRECVKYGGTIVGGTFLAGCTGDGGTGTTPTDWGELWGSVDFETMLAAVPDVFLHFWGFTPSYSIGERRGKLPNHDVGSKLTAVQNHCVHAAGMRYQGPITNLFQLEMGAKQLYPERFGEWPRYDDGEPYSEIPPSEWLFDRIEVGAIVNGEIGA